MPTRSSRREFGRKLRALSASAVALPAVQRALAQNAGAPASGASPTAADPFPGSPEGDMLPGQPWKAHDRKRPAARKITPGLPIADQRPPSDAIVLFNGADLSKWGASGRGGEVTAAAWKVENGYVEMVPRSGSLITRDSFGDIQLHIEWMVPTGAPPERTGQMRGNSGVILMRRYEVQVLSSFDKPTYSDGAAGGIYGLYPPMVNPCRPEGEWNSYDIMFEAPHFADGKVVKKAYLTLLFNGVLVQHRVELLGSTATLPLAKYEPHPETEPFLLQAHAGPIRYRNIWVRKLAGYDK